MDILKSVAQYQQNISNLTMPVSLDANKDLRSIMLYIKQYLDASGKVDNYSKIYNDFSGLYEYIARRHDIPTKILNNKWIALSQAIKNIIDSNQLSKQDIINLGSLWDAWTISNVAVLKENYVSAINDLIHKVLLLLSK